MNAFDQEDPVFDLNLSFGLADQPSFIRLDAARFQRAPEGSS